MSETSCKLRIFGEIGDPDRISTMFGLSPTHTHRKGERRSRHTPAYEHDMWQYDVAAGREKGTFYVFE